MEIELKLQVAPADVATLRAQPLLGRYAIDPPHDLELVSTYYDTPDLQVRRREAALRVRKAGNAWLQTLKGGGQVEAGLHSRHEWEGRVAGAALDIAALKDMVDAGTEWGRLVRDDKLMQALVPVFTTRFTRTVWDLRLPDGTEIECALDIGTIEHDTARTAVSELELELKAGDARALFDVALQLLDTVPLRIGNISKAERGYALFAPQPLPVVKAEEVSLSTGMAAEQAFQKIVSACLAQVQGNEAGLLAGGDPENVHQMRVGLRRLHSAFRMFRDLLPAPDAMTQEFRWLAGELGAARDWHVLATSTLAPVARAAPDAGIGTLQEAAAQRAEQHRADAAAAVGSVRYTRLMLECARWLTSQGWREALSEEQRRRLEKPVAGFAARTLARNHRRLRKRGRQLPHADPQARHRVRIAAKRTRYVAEFFAPLFPARRTRRYVAALEALQDELGLLNDIAVADSLLGQLQTQPPELAAAAGFARGYLISAAPQNVRRLRKRWKRFKPVPLPAAKKT